MTDDNGTAEAKPTKININFDLTDSTLISDFLDYKKATGLVISNAAIARKLLTKGLTAEMTTGSKKKARQ